MYRIDFSDFFSSAFSVDCIIFGYSEDKVKALLIKRSVKPFENYWAVPGDLVYPDEDLPQAAERVLFELTGFRHPEGRVITISYFALIRIEDFEVKASSWAEEVSWVPIFEIPQLAFDHNHILNSTFNLLCRKLQNDPICFDLLPERFTLNEFQKLFEYAFQVEMDKANFRKKIKNIPLIAHEEKQKNVKHRPAKLFSFNKETFEKLTELGDCRFRM